MDALQEVRMLLTDAPVPDTIAAALLSMEEWVQVKRDDLAQLVQDYRGSCRAYHENMTVMEMEDELSQRVVKALTEARDLQAERLDALGAERDALGEQCHDAQMAIYEWAMRGSTEGLAAIAKHLPEGKNMTATNVQVGDKTYPLERVVDAMLRLREDGEARFFDREAWNKAVEEELRTPSTQAGTPPK